MCKINIYGCPPTPPANIGPITRGYTPCNSMNHASYNSLIIKDLSVSSSMNDIWLYGSGPV